MAKSVTGSARATLWHEYAADFVSTVWSYHPRGFGFLAALRVGATRWQQIALSVHSHRAVIERYLIDHPREEFDLYFTPCAFRGRVRKAEFALPSHFAWADIDTADPASFEPEPNVLWRTSPGRYQGLWIFSDRKTPELSEACSKMLAYRHGADRNGWTSTKVLRIPGTFNHKPAYDLPRVRLVYSNWESQRRPVVPATKPRPTVASIELQTLGPEGYDPKAVFEKYRPLLHPRTRALIRSKTASEPDRSKCIFEIIAGLHDAKANPGEIASVIRANAYFIDKHGGNESRLFAELSRVLAKLGA